MVLYRNPHFPCSANVILLYIRPRTPLPLRCQVDWVAYATKKYANDPDAFIRAMRLIIKVGWLHSMGHTPRCQLLHGALFAPGTARTVGEQMEPMWKKLSPLVPSTRRMTYDHRIDTFSIALHHMNEEQEDGLSTLLLQKLRLAYSKKAGLEASMKALLGSASGFLSAPGAPCTPEVARFLLIEWADALTTIQTMSEDASEPADWKSEWIIQRVQLGHVQFFGEGEATLRLLFSNGGPLLGDSVQKLRDDVAKLERDHSDDLRASGWDSPITSDLRASVSFAAAFELARTSLLESYERRAAQKVCLIASIDDILRRTKSNNTGISYQCHRTSRNKYLQSLTHLLTLRQWWGSFDLALNAPAETCQEEIEQLVEGEGPSD